MYDNTYCPPGKGVMPDGTSRLSCKGEALYHFMGTSTFSEYCVVSELSVAKVNIQSLVVNTDKLYFK